jgi:hypothetical protein
MRPEDFASLQQNRFDFMSRRPQIANRVASLPGTIVDLCGGAIAARAVSVPIAS